MIPMITVSLFQQLKPYHPLAQNVTSLIARRQVRVNEVNAKKLDTIVNGFLLVLDDRLQIPTRV